MPFRLQKGCECSPAPIGRYSVQRNPVETRILNNGRDVNVNVLETFAGARGFHVQALRVRPARAGSNASRRRISSSARRARQAFRS